MPTSKTTTKNLTERGENEMIGFYAMVRVKEKASVAPKWFTAKHFKWLKDNVGFNGKWDFASTMKWHTEPYVAWAYRKCDLFEAHGIVPDAEYCKLFNFPTYRRKELEKKASGIPIG